MKGSTKKKRREKGSIGKKRLRTTGIGLCLIVYTYICIISLGFEQAAFNSVLKQSTVIIKKDDGQITQPRCLASKNSRLF